MLGEEQWDWLRGVLSEPAELRLLVSSVQVLATSHGWERWGLIPTEVTKLVHLIGETGANGCVLLSGDRHAAGIYRLPPGGEVDAPYAMYEVTSSSLTHSFRSSVDEVGPRRLGPMVHQNNFGTVSVDWDLRTVTLDLRTSDDCGLSAQPWGEVCAAHNGTAGRTLMNVTIALDELAR
jgi:alkaline phosphatase D